MSTTFTDLTQLAHIAENIGAVRSEDYSEYEILNPGKVISASRTIKSASNADEVAKTGIIKVKLTFDDGFLSADGTKPVGGYGQSVTLSSKVFEQPGRGATSQLGNYLAAAGIEAGGLKGQALLEAVLASASLPTGFFIEWENRTEKDEATGKWPNPTLKTKDFNVGGRGDDAKYQRVIEVNGVRYEARYKVSGLRFWRVA